jgi:hypothetical protein
MYSISSRLTYFCLNIGCREDVSWDLRNQTLNSLKYSEHNHKREQQSVGNESNYLDAGNGIVYRLPKTKTLHTVGAPESGGVTVATAPVYIHASFISRIILLAPGEELIWSKPITQQLFTPGL